MKKKKSFLKRQNEKKVNTKEPVETKENLNSLLDKYKNDLSYSSSRLNRLLDLLSRPSAQRWSAEKKEKMIKRHLIAEQDSSFALSTVDQVEFRLSQIQDDQE